MDALIRNKIIDVLEKETRVLFNSIDPAAPIREQISIDSMQFITIIARLEVVLGKSIPTTVMGVSTLNEFFAEIDNAVI
jgi:acyl carrier protein